MKKLILASISIALLYACAPPADSNQEPAPQEIGYQISKKGEKIPLYGGDMAAVSIVESYIKAHNDRDLETIKSLNAAEGFLIHGPNAEVIKGTEAQIELLTAWFEENNPVWKTKYLISNTYTDAKGKQQLWVTSGHDLTQTVDGKQVVVNQMHDALIVDGKITYFSVNERVPAPEEVAAEEAEEAEEEQAQE